MQQAIELKNLKPKLIEIKGEIDKSTIIGRDSASLSQELIEQLVRKLARI